MPVKAENKHRYPQNWPEIVEGARQRTIAVNGKDCCEGSPAFPDCRAENYKPHPDTGSTVVLTTAHVDHQPEHNDPSNIRRWCNRCHLFHDRDHHAETAYMTRRSYANTLDLFDPYLP